jgi:class 3 adenylate cyclase/energy-coupling factor transporter ATP-binding protein EcfA2
MDIASWLKSLGLDQYADAFAANAIDADVLPSLTADDLKDIGVVAVGHRRKLLDAIAALKQAPAANTQPLTPASAERRHLTVMFVDLVGSTELSTRLDPEDMRGVIIAYQNAVTAEIQRVGGNVAKYMGDGVLAYFGWPQAHENEPERAVRAGLAINAVVGRQKAPTGETLSARVGIATGLVVVGDLIGEGAAQEQAVVGDTPNLAARIQSIAPPGGCAVGESTRRLVAGMFDTESLGKFHLKGIGETEAFAVTGERALESRFAARAGGTMSALIGRAQELATMTKRWSAAKARQGGLVLITGEAGIGKSRIAEALIEAVAHEPHHRVRYQCSPYHSDSALHPVIQQLTLAADIRDADTPEQRAAKLYRILDGASPEDSSLIAALLGLPAKTSLSDLSPQQQRFRTLRALSSHLVRLAQDKPVLAILEDAHWIDPSTRDFVEQSLEAVANAPVLFVLTTRPGFKHGLAAHPRFSELLLNRLTREDIAAIVTSVASGKTVPPALIDEIATKSDGVPLYIEEMARGAIESGYLQQGIAIPASLHDTLMSRLDRLQPVREIAQVASVIGRAFDFRTLAAISPIREADLVPALDRLVEAELIFRQGIPPDANYLFKHALVRDAAYESLLKAKRQALHERLVNALEATGSAAPELLAHHAQAANLKEKAIDNWARAGEAAMARPAYQEAINHFTNAVALAATLPALRERELELRSKLGIASISAKGHSHPDTCTIFRDALSLSQTVKRPDLDYIAWYGLWCGHHVRSEVALAKESSRRLLAAAQQIGESAHLLMGKRACAMHALMSGDAAEGLRLHEEALALQHPERDRAFVKVTGQDQAVSARSYYAINLWAVGRDEDAWRIADESVRLAKATGHINSLGYGYMHAVLVALCTKRLEFAPLTREMLAFCTEHRMQMWREYGQQFDAIRRLREGDADALADLKVARAALSARDAHLFSSLLALKAAEALRATSLAREADAYTSEAKEIMTRTGERLAQK